MHEPNGDPSLFAGSSAGSPDTLTVDSAAQQGGVAGSHTTATYNTGAHGESYSTHTYAFKRPCPNDSCKTPDRAADTPNRVQPGCADHARPVFPLFGRPANSLITYPQRVSLARGVAYLSTRWQRTRERVPLEVAMIWHELDNKRADLFWDETSEMISSSTPTPRKVQGAKLREPPELTWDGPREPGS